MNSSEDRPPLAWMLHHEGGAWGDVLWMGGPQLRYNTAGPNLQEIIEKHLTPLLTRPDLGSILRMYFLGLRRISEGCIWAVQIPRNELEGKLKFEAAAKADGYGLVEKKFRRSIQAQRFSRRPRFPLRSRHQGAIDFDAAGEIRLGGSRWRNTKGNPDVHRRRLFCQGTLLLDARKTREPVLSRADLESRRRPAARPAGGRGARPV